MDLLKLLSFAALICVVGCDTSPDPAAPASRPVIYKEWSVPIDEVFDGGPGKDGIPALTTPPMVSSNEVSYLKDDDLVIGYKRGDDVRAYPHPILDWHEIINDVVDEYPVAIIYCPLTGTATGWERTLKGEVTTFGVSGILYNTNIIPYDRLTDSNWSQMRLDCINGELQHAKAKTFHVVETTWATWKKLYPQAKVVSSETGFKRSYGTYPYGTYKTNERILFPVSPKDDRISAKERVLGVIVDGVAKTYRFSSFDANLKIIQDNFKGVGLVVAGSKQHNFLIAFESSLGDGTALTFTPTLFDPNVSPAIMTDNEGNVWNIFGEAIEGPRVGQQLKHTTSFIGYWFSWGAFYPDAIIFE